MNSKILLFLEKKITQINRDLEKSSKKQMPFAD